MDYVRLLKIGDAKYLCKFPKIGPKTAQQIILDLKGKLVVPDAALFVNNSLAEALEAVTGTRIWR